MGKTTTRTEAASDLLDELTDGVESSSSFADIGKQLSGVAGTNQRTTVKKAAKKPARISSIIFDKDDVAALVEIRRALMEATNFTVDVSWNSILTQGLQAVANDITGTEPLSSSQVSGQLVSIKNYVAGGMAGEDARIKLSYATDDETLNLITGLRRKFANNSDEIPSVSQVIRTVIQNKKNNILEKLL